MTFYNDNDPYVAEWLRNLIAAGEISRGEVSEQSIEAVEPAILGGYTRCHFFAGIGGWDYALQLAGWPDDREVWTGSCPCQPFSVAGQRRGASDERHLWPYWVGVIRECQPATIFGEQVASLVGREWLAGVFADLEGMGYTVAGADLCAACIHAPHIRQRLYWVANADGRQSRNRGVQPGREYGFKPQDGGISGGLADARLQRERRRLLGPSEGVGAAGERASDQLGGSGGIERLGDSSSPRSLSGPHPGIHSGEESRRSRDGELERSGFWSDYALIPCLDGKARRVEPGTFPLAHGIPARVGKLRAYGNAVVPQVAAAFIRAFLDTEGGTDGS